MSSPDLAELRELLDSGQISRRDFLAGAAALGIAGTAALGLVDGPALAHPLPAKQGGTLTVAIGIDPDTLDPIGQTTTTVQNIVDMMVETLVTIDHKGRLKPLLADHWKGSHDGLSYTFTLRRGVKFHDGTPFNAAAAKANLDRMLDPKLKVPLRGIMATIDKVSVTGPYTITLHLKERQAALVSSLSQTSAGMLSPASLKQHGNSYEKVTYPVGTGPYLFHEFVQGDHVTLDRNNHYWGRKPAYQHQIMKVVPEAASREALIRSGQAQVIILPPVSDLPALKSNPGTKVLLAPSDRTIFIAINTVSKQQPLLQKREVRQALNYAVDKDGIIKSILFGAARKMDAPMAPSLFGHCKVGEYKYDPAKAKKMLEAAGAKGMAVKLISPTGRYIQDIQAANAIAGNLRAAGVNVTGPQTMDWPSYLATINQPPPNTDELHLLGWAPGYLDASQQMVQFLGADVPPNGLNTSYFNNSRVTSLVNKGNTGTNAKARKNDYCSASHTIWNDAPWIFLWVQRFPIVYSTKVKNVGYIPNEKFNTVYAEPV